MDLLYQSALAWKELTEYNYRLTYGYKKHLHMINLTFSFEDYPHLAGFQYLKDISLPNFSSARIVSRILEGKISFEKVTKAHLYEEMVQPRLEALIHLKNSLDNDFSLYSFQPKMYSFITTIQAHYLISSHTSIHSFIFIIQTTQGSNSKCDYLCCSAFRQGERNYENNQKRFSLLRKERIHIPDNTSILFYDKTVSRFN